MIHLRLTPTQLNAKALSETHHHKLGCIRVSLQHCVTLSDCITDSPISMGCSDNTPVHRATCDSIYQKLATKLHNTIAL